jgi:hypothetical protein
MSLLGILGLVLLILLVGGFLFWRVRQPSGAGLSDDERALLKARTFDRYTLRRVRKRAALSTMYQAVDREAKTPAAVRILRPDLSTDPDHVSSFKRRGEIIEHLNREHPDLPYVRLLNYGQYKVGQTARPFIAVEYFDGLDLGELLERKKVLPVAEAVAIVEQVAKALSVVLREKVWHHQMSLQAVMVRYRKRGSPDAKLVDFDLARQEQGGSAEERFVFLSPEQFDNLIVDDRSDIYSLGTLLYLLLTGRPPFPGSDPADVARMQKTAPLPPISESIPEPVRAMLKRMLERAPADRFPSMDDVVVACQALEVGPSWYVRPIPVSARPSAPPVAAAQRQRGREAAPRMPGRLRGVLREIPMMILSPFGRLFSKLTPVKFVIGAVVIVVAAAAYFLLRSHTVSGELAVRVTDSKGAPVDDAAVVIEPTFGADATPPSVKFTDVVTDVVMKGKVEAKTSSSGVLQLKYSVSPETKFNVRISAPQCLDRLDSIVIRRDTTLALAYVLLPKPVAEPVTVFLHDRAKNPIGSVTIRIRVQSGKEYTLTSDARGMASLEYDPAIEGKTPQVSLSAPAMGPEFAQSAPRPQKLSGRQLSVDMNDYFPFDQTVDKCIREAEGFIRSKDWEEARTPLLKAVLLRPGQGSAKAYTLLAQAWWEDDNDNYKETLEAAKKAIEDQGKLVGRDRVSMIEKMHYYEVEALYRTWREKKNAQNKQEALTASQRYLSMMKRSPYAGLLKRNAVMQDHRDDVQDIYDDLK